MRILVTGGTGFLGSAFVRAAQAAGHEVAVLSRADAADRNVRAPGGTAPSALNWLRGSVAEPPWKDLERFAPETCVYAAWIATPGVYLESPENHDWVRWSFDFLSRLPALGVRHTTVLGTCIEYRITGEKLREDVTPLAPVSTYARCKCELHAALTARGSRREEALTKLGTRNSELGIDQSLLTSGVARHSPRGGAPSPRSEAREEGGGEGRPRVAQEMVSNLLSPALSSTPSGGEGDGGGAQMRPLTSAATELAWARIFYPYGEGEHPARLASSLIAKLRRGEPVSLKTPHSTKDYLHADDVGAALLAVVERRFNGTINIGTGEGVTVESIAHELGRLLGRPELIQVPDNPPTDPLDYVVADATRLRSLGWKPQVTLEAGLRRLVEARAS